MLFAVYISFADFRFKTHHILKMFIKKISCWEVRCFFNTSHAKCHFFSHKTYELELHCCQWVNTHSHWKLFHFGQIEKGLTKSNMSFYDYTKYSLSRNIPAHVHVGLYCCWWKLATCHQQSLCAVSWGEGRAVQNAAIISRNMIAFYQGCFFFQS